jgi:hypothetical protein
MEGPRDKKKNLAQSETPLGKTEVPTLPRSVRDDYPVAPRMSILARRKIAILARRKP